MPRLALVTGGTRGIGLAIAQTLKRDGARVIVCGRQPASLPGLEVMPTDVTDASQLAALAEAAGPVDILVNNVGGSLGGGSFLASSAAQWQGAFALNVMPAVILSQALLPGLRARGWGRVVNIASIWGRESGGGAAYNAAKAAMISLSKSMALEVVADGVLVNCVAPGSVIFPGGGWERRQVADPAGIAKFVEEKLPRGRFGDPQEVAELVAFLASDRASLLAGACIPIDGGQGQSNL
ncbi:MAG: SDR family oxidoreductase [Bryobacteraceae bacterium]|nr:SDR family oxidoreductase [Bryobacteraceae bacterium]